MVQILYAFLITFFFYDWGFDRLCVAFLAFDVFFVVFCVTLACIIGIAVCCCLPCIIAIMYAVAEQVKYRKSLTCHNNLDSASLVLRMLGTGYKGIAGTKVLRAH